MNYATGSLAAQQNYAGAGNIQGASQAVVPPRTIASAIGRVDGLNDRLAKVREILSNFSDQIGGPRPTENAKNGSASLPSTSTVARLNDSADTAHDCLTEIESLLGCIGRALG